MISGIYALLNLFDGKFYIGKTVNFKARWSKHRNELNKNIHKNIHLQRAWNKYGEQGFIFVILESVWLHSNLIDREQHWLDVTNCYNREVGYNLRLKAENNLGLKHSQKSKDAISIAHKGLKHTEQTKIKMKGRPKSDEHKRKLAISKIGSLNARKIDKWPCADGCYCKCEKCMQKKEITIEKGLEAHWQEYAEMKLKCIGGPNDGEWHDTGIFNRVGDCIRVQQRKDFKEALACNPFDLDEMQKTVVIQFKLYMIDCFHFAKDDRYLFLRPQEWSSKQAIMHQFDK